jgi:antirestriction protein ArdC
MRVNPKVEEITQAILAAFEEGRLPAALAQTFLTFSDSPCSRWSILNRLIVAMRGDGDARGFRQWQSVGRSVRKGEKAFHILGPCMVKAKEADPDRGIEKGDPILVGFTAIPVFGYEQTEGEPLPHEAANRRFLEALPLVEVARRWGLDVTAGQRPGVLGVYVPGRRIELAVSNLSTWAHELVHGADDRLGTLKEGGRIAGEIIAELGGAVLLEVLGHADQSDRGGAFGYIKDQCTQDGRDLLTACLALVERVHACVQLILDEAEEVRQAGAREPLLGGQVAFAPEQAEGHPQQIGLLG